MATTYTDAQRENRRRMHREYMERNRHHIPAGLIERGPRVAVPADVVRRLVHTPCLSCGNARGPCRHRPWNEA